MALPKMNEKLIKKILEHIKAFPESYQQDITSRQCDTTKETPCGAIACFGGWAVLLSAPKVRRSKMAQGEVSLMEAGDLLGLTSEEGDFLFDTSGNVAPKKDYKLIQRRLTHIRESRALAIEKAKLTTKNDNEFPWLEYDENDLD